MSREHARPVWHGSRRGYGHLPPSAMTYYCPDCGRYLIRYGPVYRCFWCLGRREIDPNAVGEWLRDIIEGGMGVYYW